MELDSDGVTHGDWLMELRDDRVMESSGDAVTDLCGDAGVEFCGDGTMESFCNGAPESAGDEVIDLGSSDGVTESEGERVKSRGDKMMEPCGDGVRELRDREEKLRVEEAREDEAVRGDSRQLISTARSSLQGKEWRSRNSSVSRSTTKSLVLFSTSMIF